ncbi:MAG: glucose/mannose-6-phosphate isomerase [Parcubacteria group bacterium Gr01-1014_29]|nr:MAG: glucose/mannose-6-phosphate isomerase [Parcubacteria group bacterium Gr01-1014_29]
MMQQTIRDFPKQFLFELVVERAEQLQKKPAVIVSGMGGSHLAADLLKSVYTDVRLVLHSDYGLPPMREEDLQKCLFIASSYSGNTEEILDGLEEARKKGMATAAISVGGSLEKMAREYDVPFVKLPDTGIQPRSALGFSLLALMKVMGLEQELQEVRRLSDILHADELEPQGKRLAQELHGRIPAIYTSRRNEAVAYNWKIKCNETGKIPAFYNVFPELNHNEMTGYDVVEKTRDLSRQFHFIFLRDTEDDPRIQKRMDVCKELYMQRGLPVMEVPLGGTTRWERIFNSLLVADWFSFHTGASYGAETEQVPMVEEFKKLINNR